MDYLELEKFIKSLDKTYNVKVLGKTKFNRKIYAVEKMVNKNLSTAVLVAGIHAREWITTELLVEFINRNIFKTITHFNTALILMANPDGVELSINGMKNFEEKYRKKLLKINGTNNFSLWKANARGVDINNNFDADFKKHNKATKPSSYGYAGKCAESERETKAIVSYLKKINPFIVLSYHTKGEEIYFEYFQNKDLLVRDRVIAENFQNSTGYIIKNVESVSSGGLKDYVVSHLKIPSLTIECGSDELEHPITKLNDIFLRNKNIANDLDFAYNVFREFEENYELSRKIYEKSS